MRVRNRCLRLLICFSLFLSLSILAHSVYTLSGGESTGVEGGEREVVTPTQRDHHCLSCPSSPRPGQEQSRLCRLCAEIEKAARLGHDDIVVERETEEHVEASEAPVGGSGDGEEEELTCRRTPFWCPNPILERESWLERRQRLEWRGESGKSHGYWETKDTDVHPHWFCGKLRPDLDPLPARTRYNYSDIAVGLFSGERLIHSRATASLDTWLGRHPHRVVYAATDVPALSVVSLATEFGLRPTTTSLHDVQWAQMLGLADMAVRFPTASWYYIVGCDNYVNMDNVLPLLDAYDATESHWLVPTAYANEFAPEHEGLRRRYPRLVNASTFAWTTGAIGWFLSRPAVLAFSTEIRDVFATARNSTVEWCNCPDLYTGLILSGMGIEATVVPHLFERADAYAVDGASSGAHAVPHFAIMHYVTPRSMLMADWRAVHERLDRATCRAGEFERVARSFVDEHFTTLLRKQVVTADMARTCGVPFRGYDIVFPSRTPEDVD
jgi:hypothetical protein